MFRPVLRRHASVVGHAALRAKRQKKIQNMSQGAMQTNRHWVDMMSGLQLSEVPGKDLRSISDFTRIVQAVQVSPKALSPAPLSDPLSICV